MIENIEFEAVSQGRSEIRLQHSTGQTTVITFCSRFPILKQDRYLEALNILFQKHPDLSPDDDLFNLFMWWFAKCRLEMPFSVGTFTNDDRLRIGKRIKELREELHMDARHLSLISGINAANLCRIEQGKYSVGLDVLSKIASALGCKVDFVKLNLDRK